MKRVVLFVVLLLVAVTAVAQDASRAQVFGGYSFMRFGAGGLADSVNTNGWNTSVTGNFTKNLGITADFDGHYKDGANSYSYMFGPQVSGNLGKARPFAHALFGANRLGGDGASDTGYALGFGGGVDASLTKNVTIRLGQFDYIRTNHFDTGLNNFRFSTGIVLHLGGTVGGK